MLATRHVIATALILALIAACGSSPSGDHDGPATRTINVGDVDAAHPERDFLSFYPATLSVHAGDMLRLSNHSRLPHSVTFGVHPDRSNQPPLVDSGKGYSAVVGRPCVSAQEVTATTTACAGAPEGWVPPAGTPAPEVALPAPYAGQPFYSSGIFLGGQTVVLQVARDIKPGAYPFICLLHPTMAATLTVVPPASPTQTADDLASTADQRLAVDRTDASTVFTSLPAPSAGVVHAGAVGKEVSLEQFFPTTVSISVGHTVTWKNDSYEPHVVVLGRRLSPEDPLVFGPPTQPPGSAYAGGVVVSGLFAGRPFPSDHYSLTFTMPGTYTYMCPLHPGMAGVVEVT